MRPIPASRLGDAHGLLRVVGRRGRLRLDELLVEDSADELFPPGLQNALGRTRQFTSFARAAGLMNEDRGTVELTDMGKRYVRAGDPERPWDVSAGQAEWLQRLLRERQMTDSIYHGAAIGLSLYASLAPDFRVSTLDFGRALSQLGRTGWDSEDTIASQGRRYTTFLRDLGVIDHERRVTGAGRQLRDELMLPAHRSLADLAAELNPGGREAARAEGEADLTAAVAAVAAPQPVAPPAPVQIQPPEPPEEEEPAPQAAEPEPPYVAPEPPPRAPPPSRPRPRPPPRRVAPPPAPPPRPSGPPRPAARAAAPSAKGVLSAGAVEDSAEARDLRLPAAAYAAVAAALATGRHLLLTGPPGSGKTTLALAVGDAAIDDGPRRRGHARHRPPPARRRRDRRPPPGRGAGALLGRARRARPGTPRTAPSASCRPSWRRAGGAGRRRRGRAGGAGASWPPPPACRRPPARCCAASRSSPCRRRTRRTWRRCCTPRRAAIPASSPPSAACSRPASSGPSGTGAFVDAAPLRRRAPRRVAGRRDDAGPRGARRLRGAAAARARRGRPPPAPRPRRLTGRARTLRRAGRPRARGAAP